MPWEIVIALVIAIPIIVLPVVFIWYMNIKGVHEAISKVREHQQIRQAELRREDRVRRLSHTRWQYINAYLGSSVKKTMGRR